VLGFKVSLLGGYLRVAGFNRTYAIVLYVVLALVIVSQLIFTFLLSFACRPIARQWDPRVPGTCINTLPTYFALGGTSLAWDVLIIVLPFPILRRLQLDKRNKVSCLPATLNSCQTHAHILLDRHRHPVWRWLFRNDRSSHSNPHDCSTGHLHRIQTHHPMVNSRNKYGRHRGMRTCFQPITQKLWKKDLLKCPVKIGSIWPEEWK
jgi:hypothetical protein